MAANLALSGIRPIAPTGAQDAAPTAGMSAGSGVTEFADVLRDMAVNANNTLHKAEKLSLDGLSGGQVDTREIADAVMSAEQTLNAAIAIRDKIVTAYLEISRMQI